MECSRCKAENEIGAERCIQCGATFGLGCKACGADVDVGFLFCARCGAPLATGAVRPGLPPYTPRHLTADVFSSEPVVDGEKKLVTVLFCDIADSTPLAARLGAEAMHALLNRFFDSVVAEVHRHEGTVNQFLGDGFM